MTDNLNSNIVLKCPAGGCTFTVVAPESIADVSHLLTCPDCDHQLAVDENRRPHDCPESAADHVVTSTGAPCPYCEEVVHVE